MATDVGHAHYRWPHEDPTSTNDPQEASVAQIVDHGSISLGRYAVESLSWEKRSVFTVNRRQEELDKCSAHGLVAQKKAYFEEFYKRIRAAKSSQTDQNNHVTLDGGVSTSFPNAEAKTDVNAKHPGCETIRKYDSHVEKIAKGTDISKAVLSDSRENISFAHPELQSSPTTASLPRESSQDVEKSVYIHAIQIEHFSTEPTINDPLPQSREVIHHVGKDSHEKEAVSGENVSSLSTDELVISDGRPAAITPQVSPRKHKSLQLKISVKGETSQENTNQSKQETASVPKVKKGHAPPRGGTTKVECRNKSSHGSNPIHKQVGKADNGVHSRKTSDKPLGNDMSSSFSSSKPLPEKRSNVTIARPFSFATEKRATAPSRLRGNRQKSVSNFLASASWSRLEISIKVPVSCPSRRLASSLPHAKVFKDVQEPLDKTATLFTGKEAKIEGKRFVGSKGRVISMLESPETRSFDLPRPKESCRLGGDKKLKISDIKTKEKEEKTHGRLMPEVHLVSSEKTAPIVSGNLSKPSQNVKFYNSIMYPSNVKKIVLPNLVRKCCYSRRRVLEHMLDYSFCN